MSELQQQELERNSTIGKAKFETTKQVRILCKVPHVSGLYLVKKWCTALQ